MATTTAQASASSSDASSFNKTDRRRMLHAVFRVGDQPASKKFFTEALGMTETRFRDIPEGKYMNGFYAYGPETTNFALETTYNYGVESYEIGEGFGHFGVCTRDVKALADRIRAAGGVITREPGPVKGGTTVIAFARDPTGYMWELIERKDMAEKAGPGSEPLCQVMLRVTDLDASVRYYTEVLGMRLLRTRVNEEHKYTLAFVGYEDEDKVRRSLLTQAVARPSALRSHAPPPPPPPP
jgi:lactoylglutathione lyase